MGIGNRQIGWSQEATNTWYVIKAVERLSEIVSASSTSGGYLTDAQLRATPVSISNSSITNLDTNLGARSDSAATTDTGTFSIIAFIKRGLQNWTTLLSRIPTLIEGRIPVEPLGIPGVARQLNAGSASANTALTTTTRRVSLFARNADIRYLVGSTSQTASGTSHFIGQNERIDIDVPATPNIAVIRAGSTDGILELTELL